jgi:hypothetical protein
MPYPHHLLTFKGCHPDRSGPIFSSAPHFGASGRGVEGSQHNHRVLPPSSVFAFRFLSFPFRIPPPDRRSLIADRPQATQQDFPALSF